MADTSTTGTVLFQTGDALSEANLRTVAAKGNQTDYVERGIGLTPDHTNEELDIGAGHAVIEDNNEAYDLYPDEVTGISLVTTTGVNHVFLAHRPGTDDDIYIHIDSDDTAPADPSLKIGTVDAGNDTHTELNRAPDASFETLALDDLDFEDDESIDWGTDTDFATYYDSTRDEWVVEDLINNVVKLAIGKAGSSVSILNGAVETEAAINYSDLREVL